MREMNRRVGEIFADAARSMAVLEKRYLAGAHHAAHGDASRSGMRAMPPKGGN